MRGGTKKIIKNSTFNFRTKSLIFVNFLVPPLIKCTSTSNFSGILEFKIAITVTWQIDFFSLLSRGTFQIKVWKVKLRPNNGSPERATLGHTVSISRYWNCLTEFPRNDVRCSYFT